MIKIQMNKTDKIARRYSRANT